MKQESSSEAMELSNTINSILQTVLSAVCLLLNCYFYTQFNRQARRDSPPADEEQAQTPLQTQRFNYCCHHHACRCTGPPSPPPSPGPGKNTEPDDNNNNRPVPIQPHLPVSPALSGLTLSDCDVSAMTSSSDAPGSI